MNYECRILVIDDDVSFRRLVEKEFRASGYTIKSVSDGESALEILDTYRPHIIILDLLLPKMDGFEVARRIKGRPGFHSVHILMVTAVYLDEEDMKRAFREGANGYYFKPDLILTKPVQLKELREVVEAMRTESFEKRVFEEKLKDTILIIDDDEKNRKILKLRLLSEGFDVKEAEDGLKGLKILEEEGCDLVLLDIKMPQMSGIDLLSEIRRREIDVPVIMMTAYGSESIAVEAFKKGADDYLIKPFDAPSAIKRIEEILEKHSLKKSNEKLIQRLKTISIDLIARLNTLETQNLKLEEAYLRNKELSDFTQEFVRVETINLEKTLEDVFKKLLNLIDKDSLGDLANQFFHSLVKILNISRLTAIQSRLCHADLKKINLVQEIKNNIEFFKNAFEKKDDKIIFESFLSDDILSSDPQLLKELFYNIFSNTLIRQNDNEPLKFRVYITEENKNIKISIFDNGRTIKEEEMVRIDLDSIGSRAYRIGGESLKMSLCFYIAEMNGMNFKILNETWDKPRFLIEWIYS